ncbi:MAG: hypothetical protein AB7H71_10000 [Alphaproteobacteria bacterium]
MANSGGSEPASRSGDGGSGGDIGMTPRHVDRRLTTILAADVAEYSRLMRAGEDATLRGLTASRAIIDALVVEHRGRIANTAGDALLARRHHGDAEPSRQAVGGGAAIHEYERRSRSGILRRRYRRSS